VKYFFLSEGWTIGRVWGVGGLWNETAWRRLPDIQKLNLCLWDQNEKMWLYRVEDAILMVEVKATPAHLANNPGQNIGNVVLTRLITADQVLERLCSSVARCEILPSTSLGSSQDRGGEGG
jgi:hypothetical protein